MLTAHLKISMVLITLLLTISIAAKAIGALQPLNPALRGFVEGCEGKAIPCWFGIIPGNTTDANGQILLEQGDYQKSSTANLFLTKTGSNVCKKSVIVNGFGTTGNRAISNIVLSQCSGLQSGDLMSMFGRPSLSFPTAMMFYQHNKITVIFDRKSRWHTSLFTEVDSVRIGFSPAVNTKLWRGIEPLWKYCARDKSIFGC